MFYLTFQGGMITIMAFSVLIMNLEKLEGILKTQAPYFNFPLRVSEILNIDLASFKAVSLMHNFDTNTGAG